MPAHNPSELCIFRDTAGRRWRLPRKPWHPDFCTHHAAIAGYFCQLIIQALPQLRIESTPEGGAPTLFQFVCNVPRPDYSELQTSTTDRAAASTNMTHPETDRVQEGYQP